MRVKPITFLAILAVALPGWSQDNGSLFSFGVISDIQYADQDTHGLRHYRESIEKLGECSAALNAKNLAFVIHLGDLVDGGVDNLDRILPVFDQIRAPKHHVLGNHDFCAERSVLLKRLNMPAAYYQFSEPGWRFVVLDGMNISVAGSWPEGSENLRNGRKMLADLQQEHAANAQTWNGAVGEEQRQWLAKLLSDADAQKERVIVFAHFPALAASCRPNHLLWDHQQIVKLLEAHSSVKAFLNGHDHNGGYGQQAGIHYVTFPAMVERPAAESCSLVNVYQDRLAIQSATKPSAPLRFPRILKLAN
jgi:manganese-dependent ADP-ribose/CDP-alcohol diphosphatase